MENEKEGYRSSIDPQIVIDALLIAARDSGVSGSAGMSLGRLAMRGGASKLIVRCAELISDLAACITTASIRAGLPDRISLYKIVVSVLREAAKDERTLAIDRELAERIATLSVADLTAINVAMLAAESGAQVGIFLRISPRV